MSILQYGFMQRAFLVGILLAVITPCIGITIVLKRMSMIGDALSHSSLARRILGTKHAVIILNLLNGLGCDGNYRRHCLLSNI